VGDWYNNLGNDGLGNRSQSKILRLRNFNNWVKSLLIQTFCKSGANVLDLCGGKGGDFPKWAKQNAKLVVLADLAEQSVKDAENRYNQKRWKFDVLFFALDCFEGTLNKLLPPITFDLVSCQFSMHYSFESEQRVRGFLENVTCRLSKGGHFIATTTEANRVVRRLRECQGLSFGNSVFTITFPQKDNFAAFGAKYDFHLVEAVEGVPEYLVHFATFCNLAAEYGLEPVLRQPFHEFYQAHSVHPANVQLLHQMHCLDDNGSISSDEWEAIGLYVTLAFKKVS